MSSADQFLKGLNTKQREAVLTLEGKTLILAGAGSGKTRVLMMRMAYLIETGRAKPEEILGLTFTNRAAMQMKERLCPLVGDQRASNVWLHTFHSFCLRILRRYIPRLGFTSHFTLYNEYDMKRLIGQIAREELDHDGELPSLNRTIDRIEWARGQGVDPSELPPTEEKWHDEFCSRVFDRLKLAMRAYNALDFNGLLEKVIELIESDEGLSQGLCSRFRYIMIDEYQDTNPVQDKLAHLLAKVHGNLCVVGDDDQSIYGWRGAQVRNILDFPADTVIKLEQNYRSSNTILKAANHVISKNEDRFSKELWSELGTGKPIELFHAPDEEKEAQSVIQRIQKLKVEKNLKWSDFAILYRSNLLARPFESALIQAPWQDKEGHWHRGIPYQIFGGESFYESREVKDIVAYLRFIVNETDHEALLRIINQPRRGIGEGTLDKLTHKHRTDKKPLLEVIEAYCFSSEEKNLSPICIERLKRFIGLYHELKLKSEELPTSEFLSFLIDRINYQKAIDEEVKSDKMRQFKKENLASLVLSAQKFESETHLESKRDKLTEFIARSMLDQGSEMQSTTQKGGVKLMTFHGAKGLEFESVFLVGLEDHILPHEKSMMQTGLEEERRLLYVAITRAERDLCLSMAQKRSRFGKMQVSRPSRFLYDIPKEFLEITRWNKIIPALQQNI